MSKNIVICCDGTSHRFDESYSNVTKLFSMLTKDSLNQCAYYSPGVGALSEKQRGAALSEKMNVILSMTFGRGLKKIVQEAYGYLIEHHQAGDRIYLFGFSRGALAVRVLAAMIDQVGILEKGCHHLIPYAWKAYRATKKKISGRWRLTSAPPMRRPLRFTS